MHITRLPCLRTTWCYGHLPETCTDTPTLPRSQDEQHGHITLPGLRPHTCQQHGNKAIYVTDAALRPFAIATWNVVQGRGGSTGRSVPGTLDYYRLRNELLRQYFRTDNLCLHYAWNMVSMQSRLLARPARLSALYCVLRSWERSRPSYGKQKTK